MGSTLLAICSSLVMLRSGLRFATLTGTSIPSMANHSTIADVSTGRAVRELCPTTTGRLPVRIGTCCGRVIKPYTQQRSFCWCRLPCMLHGVVAELCSAITIAATTVLHASVNTCASLYRRLQSSSMPSFCWCDLSTDGRCRAFDVSVADLKRSQCVDELTVNQHTTIWYTQALDSKTCDEARLFALLSSYFILTTPLRDNNRARICSKLHPCIQLVRQPSSCYTQQVFRPNLESGSTALTQAADRSGVPQTVSSHRLDNCTLRA